MSLNNQKLDFIIHSETKKKCYDLYQLSNLLGYANKYYIKSYYAKANDTKEHIKTIVSGHFAPYDEIIETFTSRRLRKPLVSQLITILAENNAEQPANENDDNIKTIIGRISSQNSHRSDSPSTNPTGEINNHRSISTFEFSPTQNSTGDKVKQSIKYKVNIIKEVNRYEPVEATCKRDLMDALETDGIEYTDEYTIGKYRIDMYIPKYKVAIEIDEHGHITYDKEKEKIREDYIKKHLTNNIYRINQHNGLYRPAKIYGEIKRKYFVN